MRRIGFLVEGRVQGVGFRASAAAEAGRLGLAGFVRNRSDGAVEGEAQGDDGAVEAFVRWLGRGPSWSRVEHVDVRDLAVADGGERFEIRR